MKTKQGLRLVGLAIFLTSPARLQADDGYAIVVSKDTHAHADWAPVVEALRSKHSGIVIEYEKNLSESLPALQTAFPKYTCIVAKPEDAGRAFVASAHQLTRQLDADPYPDTIWAIVTGYEPADALRIAKHAEPLTVKRALSGTVGSPLDAYDEGVMFNELKANAMWEKVSGQTVARKSCPQDTT
ncbi:hypothetical protein OAG15_02295, partial [bacterium]|nr:hypothetical protein [bacterium]